MTEPAVAPGFCSRHHSFFCPCAAPWSYGDEERAAYEAGEPTAGYALEDEIEDEDEQLGLIFDNAGALR